MAELEIMGVPFSNYVRSIRMLCEEKGITYKLTPSRPQSPGVKAIHPAGQIPVMRHGNVSLFDPRRLPLISIAPFLAKSSSRMTHWKQPKSSNGFRNGNVKVDRWIMREFVVPSVFFDKTKGPDTARIAAALPEIDRLLQGAGRRRCTDRLRRRLAADLCRHERDPDVVHVA